MSHRKGTSSSKFGHLFGDTSESSSGSGKEGRLSSSGDLYKDPLAALLPPITATTTTTRSGASSVKATLSSPSSTAAASASAASATSQRQSPPTSGPNSRSSSRLQHHALFSSLTQQDSGSLFDSASPSTLSSSKRDFLFGDSSSNGSTSASRRTSTPPLSRISSNIPTASSQSSSRVPTPPLGSTQTRVTTTVLDADASPLSLSVSSKSPKEDDGPSILSPLSGEPMTRTNSGASLASSRSSGRESNRSNTRNILGQDGEETKAPPSPLPTAPTTTTRAPTQLRKASMTPAAVSSSVPKQAAVPDPIINPLSPPPPSSSDWSTAPSQSIETFQSISRSATPNFPVSKNGFEGETGSRPLTPSSRKDQAPLSLPSALDDAAEAFANDTLYNPQPHSRSASFLDSGVSSRTVLKTNPSTSAPVNNGSSSTFVGAAVVRGPISTGLEQRKTGSPGFSLGEDAADASNPWMNPLSESLEQTRLTLDKTTVDYTQSVPGGSFMPEVAFTMPTPSTSSTTKAPVKAIALEEEEGGFKDIFSSFRSRREASPALVSTPPPPTSTTSTTSRLSSNTAIPPASGTGTTTSRSTLTWNVADAVEAAALDPEFLGGRPLVPSGSAKVLEIMQMPKDALDKDVSAQEVFDNPWE